MDDVSKLTLAQKASLTSGQGFWYLQGIEEAGIPSIMVTDGPYGLRKQPAEASQIGIGGSVPATCFPPAVALASSWNTGLVRTVGEALGREALAEQVSVLLGPGVNIKRSPLCGRNFEYFAEDPFLAGRMGAAFVHGVQSQGVGTSLKHFAANNQETDRLRVSADVDDRTLREIYLPAFEHVVKDARPMTVMAAYNKVNGVYAGEHPWLLTEVLREEWGFDGLVVSDWGAVSDRVRALAAGLDIEMPPTDTDGHIVAAVTGGRLDEGQVDAAARRVLRLIEATAGARTGEHAYDTVEHHELARRVATECAVLLKNDGALLPLDAGQRVAVIGEFARTPRYQGAGSAQVIPTRLDNALDAIEAVARSVVFAPGFTEAGEPDAGLVAEAVEAARGADVAVLFLGLPLKDESEGYDREHLHLPADQLALLAAVHAVNPDIAVVLSNGGVVSVSEWQDRARAVLEGWLLGQAGGSAVADLLFGVANPSGRLTETIPLRLEDNPSHLYFPGGEQHVRYGEGIYVGYRYYDTLDRPVAYPFGFGLSYTGFEVGEVTVDQGEGNTFEVSAAVTNTGTRAGAQVVQVYVHDVHASVDRPVHELKGFAKVHLGPGETGRVRIRLDERAFAYWSIAESRWKVEDGVAEIRIGVSSRDIVARHRVHVTGNPVARALTPMSTISEWVDDPVGGPLLLPVLMAVSPGATEITPELRRVMEALPLAKLAAFNVMTAQQVDDLVTSYRTLTG